MAYSAISSSFAIFLSAFFLCDVTAKKAANATTSDTTLIKIAFFISVPPCFAF